MLNHSKILNEQHIRIALVLLTLLSLSSCGGKTEGKKVLPRPGKNDMTELNSYMVQKDREIIQNYIERKGLKMTESPTGLWYLVKDKGIGEPFKDGDRVLMNYKCTLLDGSGCYSSDDQGPKEIFVGKSDIEQGLDQGIRLLSRGGEALFIIPPYLAYGLIGDGKRIPPRATIVYSIKIIN